MQPPVLIARLVGPVFVVLGVGILANLELYTGMVGAAMHMPALVYISGLLSLTVGVAILNGWRAWTEDWRTIVTVLGWVFVIAGIVRIVLPRVITPLAVTIYAEPAPMAAVSIVVLLLGGFLCFKGYRR